MQWNIPGTTLVDQRSHSDQVSQLFTSMFLPGNMLLSQVSRVSGLEAYTIQNWVKRGFLSPPLDKRYSLRQLCRILNINMLKGALTIEESCSLLTYINGALDDESDDLIDDAELYFMFVRLAARAKDQHDMAQWEASIEEVLQSYEEPVPGARDRIARVLKIMTAAWFATRMRQETERMLHELSET